MKYTQYKNIFVTGGAGTLGQAIVRRYQQIDPSIPITIYSRDFMKHLALKRMFPEANIRTVLGDILDRDRLETSMVGHDLVIHAAANKHIPSCEQDPAGAVAVNVVGSVNVVSAAMQAGVQAVVGISTDKACCPVNTYGLTKALMERVLLDADSRRELMKKAFSKHMPQYSVVRYGNVIGSTGSVAQLWKQQIMAGQRITITEPRMTRFWMTSAEAVSIVLASLDFPGRILAPTAPALSMRDFARYALGDEVLLSSSSKVTGMRPGEKMHEQMVHPSEAQNIYVNWDKGYIYLEPHGYGGVSTKADDPACELMPLGYDSNTTAVRLTQERFDEMIKLVWDRMQ